MIHLDSKKLLAGLAEAEATLRRFGKSMPVQPPSMAEAAKIRDVVARHNYVFDNGLSSPDFFNLPKRVASEEFAILAERIPYESSVLEIGCFTGLNLLGLAIRGHLATLSGIDFVEGAVRWLHNRAEQLGVPISARHGTFGSRVFYTPVDSVICFDVLEHQQNVGAFLDGIAGCLAPGGKALLLVPVGREYYDCGHVAFFPDAECLRNVLDYVFDVEEIFELKTCRKLFASCRRRI